MAVVHFGFGRDGDVVVVLAEESYVGYGEVGCVRKD